MIKDKLLALASEGKTEKEIFKDLQVEKGMKKEVRKLLNALEDEGKLVKIEDRYQAVDGENYILGRLQGNKKGFGFLIPEDPDQEDVYIDKKDISTALDKDRVLVHITDPKNRAGQVVKILERGRTKLVGTLRKQKKDKFAFVVPDEHKFQKDIYVGGKNLGKAKNGDKVVVTITDWPQKGRKPEGMVVEVLGQESDPQVEIISIAREMDLPMDFSKKTKDYARDLPQEVSEEDIRGRVDFRDKNVFTIDGADSKDFDDAISIEKTKKGYRLGVHIADVSHYVREGTSIDKDAYKRGNSVYLLSKVIPMLPVELSNGICSLNPGVDRLCLSVIMDVDRKGTVFDHKIVESVIQSKARLVYGKVSDFLEKGKKDPSFKGLEEDLTLVYELAKILMDKRHSRGAIDFDLAERDIQLDDQERVLSISLAERRSANKLIEECMLLTNETVAEHFYWLSVPFVYRIHEEPDKEKLISLNQIMRPFGHRLTQIEDIHPGKIQDLLESIKGHEEYPLIEMLILRSLKKARYSPIMEGHFGLASKFYAHFTSPIRRYADLQIHRIIKEYLHGVLAPGRIDHYERILDTVAKQVSDTEKLAIDAERKVENIKIARYMEDHVGEKYKGYVSGITRNGIFVQLPNTVEGYIGYETMEGYYVFDENRYVARSKEGHEFHLGMEVSIEVESVQRELGHINFVLEGDGLGKKESQQ